MKPALWALVLSSAFAAGCVSVPPRPPAANDPANPHAQEAPFEKPPDILSADPPPAAALPGSDGGVP